MSRLFRRRECLLPTWRGWLLLLVLIGGLAVIIIRGVYPFLAVTDPASGGILVVEGWVPDDMLGEVMEEFGRHHYRRLCVTGGQLGAGAPLAEYKTFAELSAAALIRHGFSPHDVQAVPAPPVFTDRTFVSARALKDWLAVNGGGETNINVMSMGAHARRTRLLFAKALGKQYRVGIVALPSHDFDPQHWWKSSEGVRTVTGEVIAYTYARLFFREPPLPKPEPTE